MDLLEHQRMLTAIASGLVGSADADDVVQETFLRALTQPPRDTSTSVAPWLVTVAKNLAMDVLRHRGRFVDLPEDEENEAVGALPAEHSPTSLLAGLGQLSEGEVAVLLLRDWMDLDVDEVAAALGTSAGSVRVLHHRARRKAAVEAPLVDALAAVDRFVTWLLGRAVEGLPVVGDRPYDPGLTQGVLTAYLRLLDAMIELAGVHEDSGVEGRARLSRGIAKSTLGHPDAVDDLERALALGANRDLAEVRLVQLLVTRGDMERALDISLAALDRSVGEERFRPIHHRVAARVHQARGNAAAAAPHLDALRALSEGDARTAYAAFARAGVAMDEERFADARTDLLVALTRNRAAAGHSRNEAVILNNLVFATYSVGDLDEAEDWAAEGLALARNDGAARSESVLTGNAATIAALRGRFEEAVAGYERAIALCTENDQLRDAEIFRAQMAAVEHQRGNVEDAAAVLEGVVLRLAAVPGVSLAARVQHLAALAELGRADVAMFDALANEARNHPSLLRALGLYRLLQPRDPSAIARALEEPGGSALAERVARVVLARVSSTRPR